MDDRHDIPEGQNGKLYIVATPIGNQEDITLRALRVLQNVDIIAAEDTRKTRRFLSHHNIKGRLISYHEHNEPNRTESLIGKLMAGASVALVSNAGTPTVSDPGYPLVKAAVENRIPVVPVPGASAAITALSAAGLPTDSFVFLGFLAKKKAKRLKQLYELATEKRTLIIYESPKRIVSLLDELSRYMKERYVVLSREMTKRHEEFLRGTPAAVRDRLSSRPKVKGEITLLVAGTPTGFPIEGAAESAI
jgi:16S rRNA (cytidine1402-2'-O)-methyltransferase